MVFSEGVFSGVDRARFNVVDTAENDEEDEIYIMRKKVLDAQNRVLGEEDEEDGEMEVEDWRVNDLVHRTQFSHPVRFVIFNVMILGDFHRRLRRRWRR